MSEVQTPFVAELNYFMNHSFDYPSPAPAHLSPGTLGHSCYVTSEIFQSDDKNISHHMSHFIVSHCTHIFRDKGGLRN